MVLLLSLLSSMTMTKYRFGIFLFLLVHSPTHSLKTWHLLPYATIALTVTSVLCMAAKLRRLTKSTTAPHQEVQVQPLLGRATPGYAAAAASRKYDGSSLPPTSPPLGRNWRAWFDFDSCRSWFLCTNIHTCHSGLVLADDGAANSSLTATAAAIARAATAALSSVCFAAQFTRCCCRHLSRSHWSQRRVWGGWVPDRLLVTVPARMCYLASTTAMAAMRNKQIFPYAVNGGGSSGAGCITGRCDSRTSNGYLRRNFPAAM